MKRWSMYALSLGILLLTACGGGGGGGGGTTDNTTNTNTNTNTNNNSSSVPAIAGFSPTSGPDGTVVTITGSGFAATVAGNQVFFNDTAATVQQAGATQLVVKVPYAATTGPLRVVTSNGAATSGTAFTRTGWIVSPQWMQTQAGTSAQVIAANDTRLAVFDGSDHRVSANGYHWTNRYYLWNAVNDVAWGAGLFVGVGGNESVYTSTDGGDYLRRHDGSDELFGLVWTGSQFVAVGFAGAVLTSPDGLNWTKQAKFTSDALYDVAWNGQQLLAIGKFSSTVYTSADGVSWTSHATGVTGSQFVEAAGSGSRWVIVCADGNIVTSADGEKWSALNTAGSLPQLTAATWSPARALFVAVGQTGQVLSSPDGIGWTVHETYCDELSDVIWYKDRFLAVGPRGVLESSDGQSWTVLSSNDFYRAVVWDGSRFVAVGDNRTVATSADGLTWSFTRSATVPGYLRDLLRAGNDYFAAGANGVYRSSDAANWSQVLAANANALAWSGTVFVAVAPVGRIYRSTDGDNWTLYDQGFAENLADVVWTGSFFAVCGQGGKLLTSPDGIVWTARDAATVEYLTSIASSGAGLVAMGTNGTRVNSPDGIVWSKASTLELLDYRRVAWAFDRYVSIAEDTIQLSADGYSWTGLTHIPYALQDGAASPTRKVLVGSGGFFYASP